MEAWKKTIPRIHLSGACGMLGRDYMSAVCEALSVALSRLAASGLDVLVGKPAQPPQSSTATGTVQLVREQLLA